MRLLANILPVAALAVALAGVAAPPAQATPESGIATTLVGEWGPGPRYYGPPPRHYGPPGHWRHRPRVYYPPPGYYYPPPRVYYPPPRYYAPPPPPPPGVGLYFRF